LAGANPVIFMSRMLHYFPQCFQWLPLAPGGSTQHERDMMERLKAAAAFVI
jgi:hypothetical protein